MDTDDEALQAAIQRQKTEIKDTTLDLVCKGDAALILNAYLKLVDNNNAESSD
jgi:hypothetical protein